MFGLVFANPLKIALRQELHWRLPRFARERYLDAVRKGTTPGNMVEEFEAIEILVFNPEGPLPS
jgi:hypothetical protein